MKSKSRKSLKLATIIGASLLLTTGVAATLSSCVVTWKDGYFPIARPDVNGNVSQLNKKNEIDWRKVRRGEQKLIIDNGLVFKDKSKTELIAVVPQGVLSESQSLKSTIVDIPSSVKKISYYTEVSRDNNGNRVKTIRGAFENNNYITRVNLERVRTIEGPIFKNATKLTTVNLGSNLTEIPNSAFEGTTNLSRIIGSERIVKIGDLAFKNSFSATDSDLTLKDVTYIGTSAFEQTTNLKNITFSDNSLPLSLSPSTFKSSGLTTINLSSRTLNDSSLSPSENNQPNNSLPASTFEGASSLTSFTLPNSITSIGDNAFKGTSLTSLDLTSYSSLTSIGVGAFANTNSLNTITLPNSITQLEDGFLTGSNVQTINLRNTDITHIPTGALSGLPNLQTVNLPNNIVSIGDSAFANNPKLATIDLNQNGLTSIGANAFNGCRKLRNVTFGTGLTTLGESFLNGTGVTTVNLTNASSMTTLSPRAFLNNTTVTSVTLPTSVTSIGESAFEGARELNTLNLATLTGLASIENKAFKGIKIGSFNLTNVRTLTTIGDSAFEGIISLTAINLPNSVTSIGDSAFKGCTGVTSQNLNNLSNLQSIGDSAFENLGSSATGNGSNVSLQATLSSIGNNAFKGAKVNVNFNAATGLTSIGNFAFENTKTTAVDLSAASGLTSIGTNAFKGTENSRTITTIQLPTSVQSIGNQAFRYANAASVNLTNLTALTTIGEGAFADNTALNNLQLPMNADLDIQDGAFYKTTALTSITLPTNLTEIKQGVFAESGLTNLDLNGKDVNTIGQGAFFKSRLTSLDLSTNTNVTTIGPSAFAENTSLTSVKLPNSLTSLGERAFAKSNAAGFNQIDLKNTQLTTLSNETFKETNIATVTLPKTLTSMGENVFSSDANNTASSVTNVTWEPTTATSLPDNFYSSGNFGSVENLTLKGNISTLPSTNVPGGIETVDLNGATKLYALPASVFENTILQSITLPTNLSIIGQNAFKNTRLAKLDLSTTNVTSIPAGLLEGDTKLVKVKLNSGTTSIGANAFKGATMLENLNDATTRSTRVVGELDLSAYQNLSSIGADAFSGTSFTGIQQGKLPNSVSNIGAGAFSNMSALASADISNLTSLTSIPERLFDGNRTLTTVTLPTNVTSIGNDAFKGTGLNSFDNIKTLNNLQLIGNSAFEGVMVPSIDLSTLTNLKYIGSKAFAEINGLQSLNLSNTQITHLPAEFLANSGSNNAGGGNPYLSRYKQARPAAVNFDLKLPTTITTIDTNAFKDFKGNTIDLGNIKISSPTFAPNLSGNDNLTSLSVPHGVTVIDTDIVDEARQLTTLTLPGTAVNWNQSSMSDTEPNAVTALNEVIFNVAPIQDGTKVTGFDSINWDQVADIVSMFTGIGQVKWNQKWNQGTYDSTLVKEDWSSNTNIITSSSDNITKSMNNVTWLYMKNNITPNTNNLFSTITANSSIAAFKAANGNAYTFGKSGAFSKKITIKINLYTN